MTKKQQKRRIKKLMTLEEYIKSIDGTVLEVTNPYETIRFLTDGGVTCIIYSGKKGMSFNSQETADIYDKWNKGHIEKEIPSGKFKEEKKKIRDLINSFESSHIKPLYKFICDEMGYRKTLNLTGISKVAELRDIWKLIKQYERIFNQPQLASNE